MQNSRFRPNAEPSIGELLTDPIGRLLMARDGVKVSDVLAVVDRARAALRGHRVGSPTHGSIVDAQAGRARQNNARCRPEADSRGTTEDAVAGEGEPEI